MTNTNITNFRNNIFEYVKSAIEYNDVIDISTKDGSAIVLSKDEYDSMLETMRVLSISNIAERLDEAANTNYNDMTEYVQGEAW